MDAGGYCIKLASYILGDIAEIKYAISVMDKEADVDLYGSATMSNQWGETAQLSFGMDNDYRCSIEAWGSRGSIKTTRIFTAPDNYIPILSVERNGSRKQKDLEKDDSFYNSINFFYECACSDDIREEEYYNILKQVNLIEDFQKKAEIR